MEQHTFAAGIHELFAPDPITGRTLMHCAASVGDSEYLRLVLQLLEMVTRDPSAVREAVLLEDGAGITPIMLALSHPAVDVAAVLLERLEGCDRGEFQRCVQGTARGGERSGDGNLRKVAGFAGAGPLRVYGEWMSHNAARLGLSMASLVAPLLELQGYRSALNFALSNNRLEAVEALLDVIESVRWPHRPCSFFRVPLTPLQADLAPEQLQRLGDEADTLGNTALHLACRRGDSVALVRRVCRLMVDADPTGHTLAAAAQRKNKAGFSPHTRSSEGGDPAVARDTNALLAGVRGRARDADGG